MRHRGIIGDVQLGRGLGACLVLATLALPGLAFAEDPEPASEPATEVDSSPLDPSIYGGSQSASCGWPTTVLVTGGGGLCTGTLVHPELVITAAHCTGNGTGKQFGFGTNGNSMTRSGNCYPHPQYNGNATYDFAYCTLNQAVNDVPIVPILFGCEVNEYLNPGQQVTIVGYGNTNNGSVGVKYEVTTTINSFQNGEVGIGGNGLDSCQGDSGGPVYVQVDDGSWRVFGITSYGGACGGGGYYGNMATNLAWAEQQTGLDLAPCFDSQGSWTPNPECGGFPTDPENGQGKTWNEGCGGGPVSGFSATCGNPFTPEGDDEPPSVAITAPDNGTSYMTGGADVAPVTITASADDGSGFGVQVVSLRVNGMDVPNTDDSAAPYEWNLEFPQGSWTIEAVAVDYSQNQDISAPIAIGVDQEPEPPEPSDDGGEGGEEGDGGEDSDSGGDGGEDGGTEGGWDTGGLPPGFGLDDVPTGCACSSATRDSRGGEGLGGLLGLALLGLVVRRRR